MSSHPFRPALHTQPHHASLASQSRSSLRNASQVLIKRTQIGLSQNKLKLRDFDLKDNSYENTLQREETHTKIMEISRMRNKYRYCHSQNRPTKGPELHSPFVGLKVRRTAQNDYKFHSGFSNDEVLHFFSTRPCFSMKKKVVREDYEPIKRQKYRKVQQKEIHQQTDPISEERLSSQLSGWGTRSHQQKLSSSAFDGTYQIISNFPSISVGITHKESTQNIFTEQSYPSSDQPSSRFELPEHSIKVIQPSEVASINDAISIKIIQDSAPKLPAQTRSQEKLEGLKHFGSRSKQSYEQITSNKENSVIEEEDYEQVKVEKIASKGMFSTGESHGKRSRKIFEERINEKDECSSSKPIQISMKKTANKSLLLQQIHDQNNCNQNKSVPFISRIAQRQQQMVSPSQVIEQQIDGSILALKTLNSHADYETHRFPQDFRVRIREATLVDTQCWGGIESSENQERMGTVHEPKTFCKDFSTEVRISLVKSSKNVQSFHSQEDLHMQLSEESIAIPQVPLKEIISEQIESMMEYMQDCIISGSEPKHLKNIRMEVALDLQLMEQQILENLILR